MLKIGVTGGMGTGKSTVCRVFETLGVPVFYADAEAKRLLNESAEVQAKLKRIFGEEIFSGGMPDRKKIAAIVFHDRKKLDELNALLHPATIARSNEWFLQQENVPYAIKEAALIYEAGAEKQLDKVIVVTAPEELCIGRIVLRDYVTPDEVRARIRNQLPQDVKAARADFIVENDELHPVIPQVMKIHEQLVGLSKRPSMI
jgi:dephospho-CoA kinase